MRSRIEIETTVDLPILAKQMVQKCSPHDLKMFVLAIDAWLGRDGNMRRDFHDPLVEAFTPAPQYVPKLTDAMLDTPAEVQRLENALRYIAAYCENVTGVDDLVSRALRGKSLP